MLRLFARRAALSLMSMMVMCLSHARLFVGARFLFECCRPRVRSLVLSLLVILAVSAPLYVSFLALFGWLGVSLCLFCFSWPIGG